MGGMSILHWVIVGGVVLLLFGRGRISDVMGDFGKGISSFKKGLKEGEVDNSQDTTQQIANGSGHEQGSAEDKDKTAG